MSLRDELRAAIGTTDAAEGLPHWHYATGGTSSNPADNDRDGVFVDRQAVLDVIDRVLVDRPDGYVAPLPPANPSLMGKQP